MRRINHCMNKQLQSICQKAVEIDKLNLLVKQFLPTHLSEHCRVSSFSKGTLTVQIDDPAWATELRYSLPELRDALRKEGLYQLISVKLALANENYTLPSSNKKSVNIFQPLLVLPYTH